jgi:50S ribosomal protein L16 3-hydroxylase
MDRSGALNALVYPLTAAEFLARHWPDCELVSHGPLERFEDLAGLPELQRVEALLRAARDRCGPAATVSLSYEDDDGQHRAVEVPLSAGEVLYGAGKVTLAVLRVERFVPPVRRLLDEVVAALPTRSAVSLCNAFASPAGVGTRMHFDAQDNFLVQLAGTKEWRIAANEQLRYPTATHVPPRPPAAELALTCAEYPSTMPQSARSFALERGSVAFIPRGHWHASRAGEAGSLALTLSLRPDTWVDAILARLRATLAAREAWRAPVDRRAADDPAALGALREELAAALRDISLGDVARGAR